MDRRWWAGPGLGWAGPPGPAIFYMMGHGPARLINFFIWWAAARPGPSNFQRMGRGPARPINFSRPGPARRILKKSRPGPARPIVFPQDSAPPGPAHHMAARPMKHGLCMGRPDNYMGRPVDLTGRLMCCTVGKGAYAYADVIF